MKCSRSLQYFAALFYLMGIVVFHCEAQTIPTDSLGSEKQVRQKVLNDIHSSLINKNTAIDSTVKIIDTRLDKIDSMIRISGTTNAKSERLTLERVQELEDRQKALDMNQINIYQANYQSAIINLLSIEREIRPLVLFNATRDFFNELQAISNPMNYPGYQEWFQKFKDYIKKEKDKDVSLAVLDNMVKLTGTVSNAAQLSGTMSQFLFSGMTSYINSMKRRQKELKDESQKMFILTMTLCQFTDDRSKIEHEWLALTDELQFLQESYQKTLERNLKIIDVSMEDFDNDFSTQNDADKRYLYLTDIRQKTADVVLKMKEETPKDWKEKIYFELSEVQSLKLKYGEITTEIKNYISQYEVLITKYEDDKNMGSRIHILSTKLNRLKDTFDKAFEPSDYINSIYRMYKVM